MSLYYSINDVLDNLEKSGEDEPHLQALIPVSVSPPEKFPHSEDLFILASTPKLLDLREGESAYQLARLLEEVPLYNINMELIMDQALTERHRNNRIASALQTAFGNQPLPNTLTSDNEMDDLSGGLKHPMLGHIDKSELCRIYLAFVNALDRQHDVYGFEKNILGKHPERFLERFDGFVSREGGKVKAQILIAFGVRQDHDPGKPFETHVQNGEKKALKMNIDEPRELLWAWLEADHYQTRRCRDLDRVMRVRGLPKTPNWVRSDIFCCLEKEAMKQVFARSFSHADPGLSMLESCKNLQLAIRINAGNEVDRTLQVLLSQVLSQDGGYSGAAAKFAESAAARAQEAQKSGLV